MVRVPRWLVSLITILLLLNPAVSALIGFYQYKENFLLATIALGLYAVVGLISILYYRQLRMPIPLVIANLLLAALLPTLVNVSLDASARGTQATWYVSGVATLMAIVAVRQHKVIAWLGSGILFLHVISFGGVDYLFQSGLAGALGLVVAAHALSVGLEKSASEQESYLEIAKVTEAETAVDTAIRNERSRRLTKTLQGTMPMLEKISIGQLTDSERIEARLLEAELRDEIRGRQIINDEVRRAVKKARGRGMKVVLLDEGGLDSSTQTERDQLRKRIARELDQIQSGRVTIRAPHQDKAKITFVASRPGTAKPDVWLRL